MASVGCQAAGEGAEAGAGADEDEVAPRTGGLQQEGFEPVTVVAGRYHAVSADLAAILDDFEARLATGAPSEGPARTGVTVALPRAGAFPLLRDLFREGGFSSVVESMESELARDLFQYIAGICWALLLATARLERRAGVVFLVYLLYHSQYPGRSAVPVDVVTLEALAQLREECERRQVLMECPKILQKLASEGVLSVGVRGTYRNVFFDRRGRVAERKSPLASEEAAATSLAYVSRSGKAGVRTQRLRVSTPGPEAAAGTMVPVAQGVSEVADAHAAAAQDGEQVINLEGSLQEAAAYDAKRGEASAGGSVAERLQQLVASTGRYQLCTPPEPRELVLESTETSLAQPLEPELPRRRRTRKRRLYADSVSGTDSGDSLLERIGGPPRNDPSVAMQPTRLRSKGARQARLVGLRAALQRRERHGFAPPLQPEPAHSAGSVAATAAAQPSGGGAAVAVSCSGRPEAEPLGDGADDHSESEASAPCDRTGQALGPNHGDGLGQSLGASAEAGPWADTEEMAEGPRLQLAEDLRGPVPGRNVSNAVGEAPRVDSPDAETGMEEEEEEGEFEEEEEEEPEAVARGLSEGNTAAGSDGDTGASSGSDVSMRDAGS
mmetsp:Transcript_113081/g.365240  ORF Transcript_113081/g.365240 Transcript_113081/m.365240 type:complete len:611 (-) Transcript_113081:119-1951(-)